VFQDNYIQSRSTAIESIESTIAELGQIFTQLATMVAEQRETVQRIDADTIDIASNVSGAQRELLKYYASISSNRWLMLKVFGVLIVFVSETPLFVVFCGKAKEADARLQFLVFILVS
jgi:syntaxin 5